MTYLILCRCLTAQMLRMMSSQANESPHRQGANHATSIQAAVECRAYPARRRDRAAIAASAPRPTADDAARPPPSSNREHFKSVAAPRAHLDKAHHAGHATQGQRHRSCAHNRTVWLADAWATRVHLTTPRLQVGNSARDGRSQTAGMRAGRPRPRRRLGRPRRRRDQHRRAHGLVIHPVRHSLSGMSRLLASCSTRGCAGNHQRKSCVQGKRSGTEVKGLSGRSANGGTCSPLPMPLFSQQVAIPSQVLLTSWAPGPCPASASPSRG